MKITPENAPLRYWRVTLLIPQREPLAEGEWTPDAWSYNELLDVVQPVGVESAERLSDAENFQQLKDTGELAFLEEDAELESDDE